MVRSGTRHRSHRLPVLIQKHSSMRRSENNTIICNLEIKSWMIYISMCVWLCGSVWVLLVQSVKLSRNLQKNIEQSIWHNK